MGRASFLYTSAYCMGWVKLEIFVVLIVVFLRGANCYYNPLESPHSCSQERSLITLPGYFLSACPLALASQSSMPRVNLLWNVVADPQLESKLALALLESMLICTAIKAVAWASVQADKQNICWRFLAGLSTAAEVGLPRLSLCCLSHRVALVL